MSFFDNKLAIPFIIILILFGSVAFALTSVLLENTTVSKSGILERDSNEIEAMGNEEDDDDEMEFMKQITGNTIPLKEAKLNIEHNAKDEDTGFQGFIDSEGWDEMAIIGPNGIVAEFEGDGKLGRLGLTELFFESVEPENADVSISDVLKFLPEGEYTFRGNTMEVGHKQGTTIGIALLTHNIPEGPVLLQPDEGAVVPVDNLTVSWKPVTKTIDGSIVNIISYQLIIEKVEEPHKNMIGKRGLSMYLPASITQITIPKEFLEPNTNYVWEVLAIEESGNQTLMSSVFSTRA